MQENHRHIYMAYGRFILVWLRGKERLKMLMGVCGLQNGEMGLIWLDDMQGLLQVYIDYIK